MKSYFCQDEYGQIAPVYSISAGLDYPGVGPEHAYLKDIGRAQYVAVTDDEAVEAFEYLSRTEGIIPAIESSHAVAYAMKLAPTMSKDQIFIPFITAGDPSLEITEQLVYRMAEAGADLIELGIPFSDPVAEGPVIQEADYRALSAGTTTDKPIAFMKTGSFLQRI